MTQSGSSSHSGSSYSATSSFNSSRYTSESSTGTVGYAGMYSGGSLALNSASFGLTGSAAFSYSSNSEQTISGTLSGSSIFSVNGSGAGSYSVSGSGGSTTSSGALALASFTLSGRSVGTFSSSESGTLGGTTYSHSSSYNGVVSYNETGSLLSTLAWDFSAFTRTVTGVQASNGVVGGNSDTFQAWQTAVLTGTGGTGTLTTTGHGTYSWNTREYWYDLPGTGVTTTLTGISLGTVGKLGEGTLPPDLRTAVTLVTTKAPAFGAGVLQQAVAGQQQAVLGVAAGLQGVGGLVAAPPQVLGLMPLAGQALPPSWSGVGVLGPNGGSWVGLQGPAAQAGAWGWLSTQATNLWALVGGAYQEASQRAQNAQPLSDPLTLQGQGLWNRQLGQLPAGTVRGRNWQAAIGDGWDALVGTIDGLTSGLRQGLNALGLGGVATLLGGPLAWLGAGINAFVGGVNESSAAYQQGRMVGQVAALAISFLPVGLPLKLALGVAQGLGGGLEALARGDWWGVAAGFTGAVLSGLGLAGVNSACGLLQSTNAGLRLLGRAMQGLQVVSAAAGVVQGARALAEGDILGGLLQIGMSARSLTGLMRACFPAGTPVLSAEDEGFNELLLLALAAAAFLIGVLGDRMMNDRRKREQEEAEEDLAPDYFLTIDYLGENP